MRHHMGYLPPKFRAFIRTFHNLVVNRFDCPHFAPYDLVVRAKLDDEGPLLIIQVDHAVHLADGAAVQGLPHHVPPFQDSSLQLVEFHAGDLLIDEQILNTRGSLELFHNEILVFHLFFTGKLQIILIRSINSQLPKKNKANVRCQFMKFKVSILI